MEENLIAPCGMNCALCVSYLFSQYDLKMLPAGKSSGKNRREDLL